MKTMAYIVQRFKVFIPLRELALAIVDGTRGKDHEAEARRVFDWVKENITYRRDVRGVETIASPMGTIQTGAGDCDDQAVLIAVLCMAIGIPARFKAVGFIPGKLSHVYAQVRINGQWVAMDTTEPQPMGWQPPGIVNEHYQAIK